MTIENEVKNDQIKKLEESILKAFNSKQRSIRRKNAKRLKINWQMYKHIESQIVDNSKIIKKEVEK